MNYKDYLKSKHWKITRYRKLKNRSHKCCICHQLANTVHHLSYKRLGRERPSDLRAICSRCHDLWHNYFKFPITKSKKTKKNYPKYLWKIRNYLGIFENSYVKKRFPT
jgi:5-methylcytosine-specific restriction endonuclease McrA